MKVIFLGTSSNVGKTVIAASFCRYLSKKGFSASPFKGSNLSSDLYITDDGGAIGMGQYIQSCACSKEPSADMNPILFRPSENGIRTIVKGKDSGSKDTEELVSIACDSFDRLSEGNDAVVCEGSGSPVELNLMKRDVANIRMVKERRIPAVLIGDIERGGVFAAIYGTWLLIPKNERSLVRGFIINRFRGRPSSLNKGIKMIEELTGMRCLGIVPFMKLDLPEEDIGGHRGSMSPDRIVDSIDIFIDNCGIDFGSIIRMSDP